MESIDIMPMRIRIAAELRKAIFAGEFKEGQSLQLTEISKRLGISRTPVREAFQTLEAEGFLELRMNKHALVRGINLKFIQDHYRIRILLEGEATFCATKNNMDTSLLVEKTKIIKSRIPNFTADEYTEHNQLFHASIWDTANNKKLYNLLMGLWNGTSIGKILTDMEHFTKSISEHEKIIQAISKRQAEKAKELMSEHIFRGMQNMLKSYPVS